MRVVQRGLLVGFSHKKIDTRVLSIDRRDFGLGGGIKFVTIADRVDVAIDFKATRGGPPLVFKH